MPTSTRSGVGRRCQPPARPPRGAQTEPLGCPGQPCRLAMPFVGSIGPLELLVVLGIILLIFGPKRLPGAGRALGHGIREFKDSISGPRKGRDGEDGEP